MIFVTVGTHEQPFNRLVEYIDNLKREKKIDDDVFIQTGYSTYEPKHCKWSRLIPYDEIEKNVMEARIVITHGGPASFILPLQMGKIPIVVPRQQAFNEHVNNHQLEFTNTIVERMGTIIAVVDIEKLGEIIENYNSIVTDIKYRINSNNEKFCNEFEEIVNNILVEK